MFNFTHWVSLFVITLIAIGISLRKDRSKHIPIMFTAFAIDVSLVIYLEFTRMAVEKSFGLAGQPLPGPLLAFHIAVSILVLVLYGFQINFGIKLKNGNENIRKKHRTCAMLFILMRLLNFATSLIIAA
ncbi:MAG: DUF420 domain-containing protein [Candidatus Lindowbacteria bacterium]|nr:DUF420 domain-containing protein [Candidatus Lindowbacteria bacterium]